MAKEKPIRGSKPEEARSDAAHQGNKPGETNKAPEHDPSMEKSGRREFGRDG